jgi:hypothetical protein
LSLIFFFLSDFPSWLDFLYSQKVDPPIQMETSPVSISVPFLPPKTKHSQDSEAQRIGNRLDGFNDQTSEAWYYLRRAFGEHLTHSELRSVAQVMCAETGLSLDRDAIIEF